MNSRVLSIGIEPQERARLCVAASEEVCLQAAHYVQRAAQASTEDAAAEPYVRAVYVCQAFSVAAERVNIASGVECGSYLRDMLRACVAGSAANSSVPCWLTVTLEDTCIVQHAVFAISKDSPTPQRWKSVIAMQPDGHSPCQPGAARWSLSAHPVPGRAAPGENVYTPPEVALGAGAAGGVAAAAPVSAAAPRASPQLPQHSNASSPQASATPLLRQPMRPQGAAREAVHESAAPPLAVANTVRRTGTTPCVHSARALAKAVALQRTSPKPLPQQPQKRSEFEDEDVDHGEAPLRFAHMPTPSESYPGSSAQSSNAPKRGTACLVNVSGVYDKVERHRAGTAPDVTQHRRTPCEEERLQSQLQERKEGGAAHSSLRRYAAAARTNSGAPSESSNAAGPRCVPPSPPPPQHSALTEPQARSTRTQQTGTPPSADASRHSSRAPHQELGGGLIACDSPRADLVMPSNGRQWGDLAYRTRYSPRREELWEIADAVMTHNYRQATIGPGEEPAYIEDYYCEREAEEEL